MEERISVQARREMEALGFKAEGWCTVKSMMDGINKGCIPENGGVYMILRSDFSSPEFTIWEYGICYEKKDKETGEIKPHKLMYSIGDLENSWIPGTAILYIGKGDNLKRRINEYIRYYKKLMECQYKKIKVNNVSHRGGRSIWQIKDAEKLIVAWMSTPGAEPVDMEKQLIIGFKSNNNGKFPFANKTV